MTINYTKEKLPKQSTKKKKSENLNQVKIKASR